MACTGLSGSDHASCVHTLMAAVGLRAGGIESGGLNVDKEAVSAGGGDGADGDDGVDGASGEVVAGGGGDVCESPDVLLQEDEAAFYRKVRNCVRYISRHQFPQARPSSLVPVTPKAVYSASQKRCSCGGFFMHDGEVDATLITGVRAPSLCQNIEQ